MATRLYKPVIILALSFIQEKLEFLNFECILLENKCSKYPKKFIYFAVFLFFLLALTEIFNKKISAVIIQRTIFEHK